MKKLSLIVIFIVLGTFVYAASPAISVKKKSITKTGGFPQILQKASNTSTGETLFTFDIGPFTGILISPTGKTLGKPFSIAEPLDHECCFLGNSVAYNPVLQEYFAVYSPWDPGVTGSILAVHLDSHGKIKGKEITILEPIDPPKSNDLGDNSFPRLIFNPKTNGYVMIWERTEGIAAALLDENGKLTSPIKIIKSNPGSNGFYDNQRALDGRIEDVQWQASGKKLLVVFQQRFSGDFYGGESDDWLAVLDPLLQKPAKLRKINTSSIHYGGDISLGILPDDTACVIYNDNEGVKGRTISSKGKFSSAPFPAFSMDVPLNIPRVAFSTTAAGTVGLLIAHDHSPAPIGVLPENAWAQTLDTHCRPTGEAKIVDTLQDETDIGGFVFALPANPSDNSSQFIWMEATLKNPTTGQYVGYLRKLKLQVTP